MAEYDTQKTYTASYVIFRKDNLVAFVLRAHTSWMNNHYGLPSGKVELGESFTRAAIREAKEEVGVKLSPEQLRQVLVCQRQEKDDDQPWVDVFFEVTDWDGELINAELHMHSELAWFDLDNLPDNVIPSLSATLDAYRAGKTYFEYGWN
jgi:ADP-ribose pyrophosphatase YjhB (NUDIX family)